MKPTKDFTITIDFTHKTLRCYSKGIAGEMGQGWSMASGCVDCINPLVTNTALGNEMGIQQTTDATTVLRLKQQLQINSIGAPA